MPKFEIVTMEKAVAKSARGKRAQILKEYLGYLEQLKAGQAGKIEPSTGETVGAVRRRLGEAARLSGKKVVIKRAGNEVYFWAAQQEQGATPRKRGRPRKSPLASS